MLIINLICYLLTQMHAQHIVLPPSIPDASGTFGSDTGTLAFMAALARGEIAIPEGTLPRRSSRPVPAYEEAAATSAAGRLPRSILGAESKASRRYSHHAIFSSPRRGTDALASPSTNAATATC